MNILITGASGFVGRRLLATLAAQEGVFAQGASRRASRASGQDIVRCGNLSATCEWQHLLNGMDVVVHCAARAHVLNDSTNDPWAAFYQANVQGTLSLASQAVQAGVKRFVFISTIGVNGSKNTIPFTEHHLPQPVDPYARSKWQAEVGLKDIAKNGLGVGNRPATFNLWARCPRQFRLALYGGYQGPTTALGRHQ
ncbi:NAD-dependent epimerase/dehydratase family protein [Modicisalibacter luteus]|uniref:NAD-dependent epimerase/dehydratase family protein n=1 Tax=Modicisalibacter luteus TaxID=453962 RepID=UPI0036259F93